MAVPQVRPSQDARTKVSLETTALRYRGEHNWCLLSGSIPANVAFEEGVSCAGGQKVVFFLRSKLTLPEGEGPASRSKTLAENGHRRALTPAVILFISLPEAKSNT